MESVLVGVDRSVNSQRAIRFAMERAKANSWRVTVAHVINWNPYRPTTPQENENRPVRFAAEMERAKEKVIAPMLKHAEEQHWSDGVEVDTVVRFGRPSEVLADIAATGGFDIIVVARAGESNLRVAIFGSTASRLAQYATVPVVVVP
ncbi:universal stress protein [Corynebacterium glyciniphilum]|uniref:universal stress protein n=1 Tax=Corynebacterium glyciniphilum TaxID=1404244 RepID=UPI0011AB57DD|nr:universal stress protein [Corynebacterium glyciniphilum]